MATGDVKIQYAASLTGTCTLTTLVSSTLLGRQCVAFSNTASNFTDGILYVQLKTTTGTHGDAFVAYLYGYASVDGTNWSTPVTTSTDANLTLTTGMNMFGPAIVNFGTSVTGLYSANCMIASVANFFGGQLPQNFSIVVNNRTNIGLTNVAGDHMIQFYPTFENVST